jgi:bifunctional DNase/RNase
VEHRPDDTVALTVVGLHHDSEDEEFPLLVLRDDHGRTLEIRIGLCEAMAIQLALAGASVPRPLTHDLFVNLTDSLDTRVAYLLIDDFSQGTYYARLVMHTSGDPVKLDCRPSDGIAIALRTGVSILATAQVMEGGE